MPHNSTGPGKKTTVFLSLRLPLVSGHFVSILRAKNTGRKRTSRDHGCSPVLLPCRSGRMSEIDADQCHFVMPFTANPSRKRAMLSSRSLDVLNQLYLCMIWSLACSSIAMHLDILCKSYIN